MTFVKGLFSTTQIENIARATLIAMIALILPLQGAFADTFSKTGIGIPLSGGKLHTPECVNRS
jgi:hypothetical protein